jgi:hypothetical protein
MSQQQHPSDKNLALFAAGDLSGFEKLRLAAHVRNCPDCSATVDLYRADRAAVKDLALRLPDNLDWSQLSEEMTANIRVGLAAAQCVERPARSFWSLPSFNWKPVYILPATLFVFASAWWLNAPYSTSRAWSTVAKAVWTGRPVASFQDPVLILEATRSGVELKQNGAALALLPEAGSHPVAVSVSMQGAARARYVDDETGQVTITSVYGQ